MKHNLRSEKMQVKYDHHKATGIMERTCVLCDRTPSKSYQYWKIIPNHFPYDMIAKKHDMLLPLRHVVEDELTPKEIQELVEIKKTKLQDYEFIFEPTAQNKSIPAHFHIHILVTK